MNHSVSGMRQSSGLSRGLKKPQAYRRMNNGGRGGYNARNMSNMKLEYFEPVLANVAIFIALIVLDIFNNTKSLIPVHAIAGIVITLGTLALCRYGYVMIGWISALLPGLFLLVSFLYAASKNEYVISAGNSVKSVFNQAYDTVDYAGDQAWYAYEEARKKADMLANYAVKQVDSLNRAGSRFVTDSSESWDSMVRRLTADGVPKDQAAAAATAAKGAAPAGSTVAEEVRQSIASGNTSFIKGEYDYLCGTSAETTPSDTDLLKSCTKCHTECMDSTDVNCKDKCTSKNVKINLLCLGGLSLGYTAPSAAQRDNCISCIRNPPETADEKAMCFCSAMNNCPTKTVAELSAIPPAAAAPAAETVTGTEGVQTFMNYSQAFTNYRGGSYR